MSLDVEKLQHLVLKFVVQHNAELKDLAKSESRLLELASVIAVAQHFETKKFQVSFMNPLNSNVFRMKLNTNGDSNNYSFVLVQNDSETYEVHANLLVKGSTGVGVFCVDVGIINHKSLPANKKRKGERTVLENGDLLTFVEVKKLVVYPMLLAQFLGIVHEVKIEFLTSKPFEYLEPALVSLGRYSRNSKLIFEDFIKRGYNINVVVEFDRKLLFSTLINNESVFNSK